MKSVFHYFIKNYKLTLLVSVLFLFLGLSGIRSIKRETRPPVDFASASIITVYPGSSPQEIEEGVTDRIEERLRGIEGVKDVTSTSEAGRSQIVIRIDMDHYDSQEVLDEIQREIQRVTQLPEDLPDPPLFTHYNAAEIPILKFAVSGSNENRKRDRLVRDLQDELEDVSGVSAVQLSGFREREFQVLLDSQKMDHYYVGIQEVVDAVKTRTQNIPAGYLKQPGDQRLVRVTGQIKSVDELADIIVRSNFSGQSIRIKDIAQVNDGMEDPTIYVRVNSLPSTTLVVTKTAEADTIRVNESLLKTIETFKKKLPEGYSITIYDNESDRIANRLEIVLDNALFGLALVLVILFLFLPGYLGAVAALSLPLSILGTVGMMPILGVNFNNITLLAFVIALGMLVDNAVVISENYARLRFEGLERGPAALKAVHQFWLPIVATVATTVIAFLPMLVTSGIMGQFIKWIPIMVSVALAVSLFEAFIMLPARLQFTVRQLNTFEHKSGKTHTGWFDVWKNKFEDFMRFCVRRRYLVTFTITAAIVSSGVVSAVGNRFELFPSEHTEYYNAKFEMPISSTLEQTDEASAILSDRIMKTIGSDIISYIITNTGSSQFGFRDPQAKTGSYVGMLTIAVP
ncbi:MAG: efflux RND transporter permease subunit, partial [Bdellovibrionales bacterium]|nr:efflux RND transporter permease subunit [Bdellovibrionales bacterium]